MRARWRGDSAASPQLWPITGAPAAHGGNPTRSVERGRRLRPRFCNRCGLGAQEIHRSDVTHGFPHVSQWTRPHPGLVPNVRDFPPPGAQRERCVSPGARPIEPKTGRDPLDVWTREALIHFSAVCLAARQGCTLDIALHSSRVTE